MPGFELFAGKEPPHDLALKDFNKAIELVPDWDDAYYERGKLLLGQGDVIKAQDDFEQAVRINPKNARAWYNLGRIAALLEPTPDRAIACYSEVIKIEPTWADPYFARAQLRHDKADLQGAIDDLSAAIGADAKKTEYYYERGLVYTDNNNLEERSRISIKPSSFRRPITRPIRPGVTPW